MGVEGISPEDLARLSATGLKAFFSIVELWSLDEESQADLLGLPNVSTLRQLRLEPKPLSLSLLERISHVIGIYKTLHILLPTADRANDWINRKNDAPLFEGKAALEIMRQGVPALYAVRSYLEQMVG